MPTADGLGFLVWMSTIGEALMGRRGLFEDLGTSPPARALSKMKPSKSFSVRCLKMKLHSESCLRLRSLR